MSNLLWRYARWLHLQWPAGTVEELPEVNEDGTTAVPGLRVVGDLTGIPLLKFAADSGARAVAEISEEKSFQPGKDGVADIAIVGAGVSGLAAAIEARRRGLSFTVFEAAEPFSTIVNFPKAKPIYTYPSEMVPAGDLAISAQVKEALVEELEAQRRAYRIEPITRRIDAVTKRAGRFVLASGDTENFEAQRVIVAIGRSGNFRKLGVSGEDLDKVYNRLHDPNEYHGLDVMVVGGGDSALEASIALALAGAKVTHSYRREAFSRPKPENLEKFNRLLNDPSADVAVDEPSSERVTTSFSTGMCTHPGSGSICKAMPTDVVEIRDRQVLLRDGQGSTEPVENDVVFLMIGREPPLEFFRRAGVPIRGEWRWSTRIGFGLFALFCVFLYHWKKYRPEFPVQAWFRERGWFPFNVPALFDAAGGWLAAAANTPTHLLHTLKQSMSHASFYYTLAYCALVVVFGIRRIRRRRTPYVKWQTLCLMSIQCIPLFILPEILLPWLGRNGVFDGGSLAWIAGEFFPGESWWHAYGLILAWPLVVFNVFTEQPMVGWLVISFLQTFILIPLIVLRWGKGAYCGWICSCGALAETLGDAHRHKMPHGPFWNRVNFVGQALLVFLSVMLLLRIAGWIWPGTFPHRAFDLFYRKLPFLNYEWTVDLMMAGVIGVACYFWFSGRVFCRFICPLAALMHIYARFSRFRIFSRKSKCISCNVCTSVCHQGIDVMSFANKGIPMADPECVRCSACVQSCPTGVLAFGRTTASELVVLDRLSASPVASAESRADRENEGTGS